MSIIYAISQIEKYLKQLTDILGSISEESLWNNSHMIPNSVGAISRHLSGNIKHFLGTGILNNRYVRDKDNEFNGPPVVKKELLSELDQAYHILLEVKALDMNDLAPKPHITPCGEHFESLMTISSGFRFTSLIMLVKLTTHKFHQTVLQETC